MKRDVDPWILSRGAALSRLHTRYHGPRMLQEEFGSTQESVSPVLAPTPDSCEISDSPERSAPQYEPGPLAAQLIERCCGSHSLGLVYSFLRKAGLDEGEARAEFEQFLSGTLSERVLDTATRWIQAERG